MRSLREPVKINGHDGGGVYSSLSYTAVSSHSVPHCKIGLVESPYLDSTERLSYKECFVAMKVF